MKYDPDRGDPYLYPGTAVLRNRFDIRDSALLEQVERELVAEALTRPPPKVPLTPVGYARLHRHLFGDVYPWAGEM